jgi:U32 family peptidase
MKNESSSARLAPELLAPAGNWECIHAAIENGADAVYFGLDTGFNARARAVNFSLEDLPSLMRLLHRRGLVGYVTLNTLIFTDELAQFEKHVAELASAGVDAVLVQDLGAVRLIHEICPELSVHSSTQMTMTSADTIRAIEALNVDRVVLARELSIAEIRKITAATKMPVETFVHGALCVSYSGQCLTSESLGGRSANRGQCAQACRLNYDLLCDGEHRDLGDNRYLLSPQDLAGYAHIPDLIDAGVCSLKIEGRLKTPEYVANIVGHYRKAIDAAMAGQEVLWSKQDKREMEMSFSRGFTPGWLEGCDHKRLVPGITSAKQGVRVGKVIALKSERLLVDLEEPLIKGDGIVLQGDRISGKEIGGRIFQVYVNGKATDMPSLGRVELAFQNGLFRNVEIKSGQTIWQTDSPQLSKRLRSSFASEQFLRKLPIELSMNISVGAPITAYVSWLNSSGAMRTLELTTEHVPAEARKHSITEDDLRQQMSRLGNTPYELTSVKGFITGNPMVPLSVLGELRKQMVVELDRLRTAPPIRTISAEGVAKGMLAKVDGSPNTILAGSKGSSAEESAEADRLHVLVRTMEQLKQVLVEGQKTVYVEFQDIRDYREAVVAAREAKAEIYLATLRIQKPGEQGLFKALAKHDADGWLVRNLAALDFASANHIPAIGDFSLNVTNPLTAEWLMSRGLRRITASYDLNRDQLNELVQGMPASWLEVVIHQHMPMFHMEHCVFCTVLSPGTNKSNCGRPCDRHEVKLRDRLGVEHVLHADIGCRNTLYNGHAQSGAEAAPKLLRMGIEHFRIELLRDAPASETSRLIGLYRDLLAGRIDGQTVWKSLKAENRVGVTRGTLEHPRNPLAIL